MSSIIRINPDTMNARARQYRNEAEKIGQVISSMDALLNALQSEWEGEASRAYAERYQSDLKPSFQRAQDLVNEIAASLDKTATVMGQQDAQAASAFHA